MSDPQPGSDLPAGASETGPALAPKRRDPAARGQPLDSRRVLGLRVDATSYVEASETILELAAAKTGGMVCVATVHMVMEAFDDPGFRRLVNAADRVTPDGMPLVWSLRAQGVPEAVRVYGPDLLPFVCGRAAARGVPVGLYGGRPEVVERLREALLRRFPGLELPFAVSPPFRALDAEEDERIAEAIDAAGVGVLFVGLGCPRQERWMAEHRERLSCALVGVGAAFDFLAGARAQAPAWMRAVGLEWLFRLGCEPRRLWRRYLVGNSRFVFHHLLQGHRI